jgi:hypothetical protein
MGDRQRSLVYALKTLAIAQQLRTPERLVNAYGQLSESYRYLGRYDSALYYNTRYNALSDSLANLDKTRQIADMQAKYESVKKESEIQSLNIEKAQLVGIRDARTGRSSCWPPAWWQSFSSPACCSGSTGGSTRRKRSLPANPNNWKR